MNDTVEKSCWSVTLWTVAIVLGAAFFLSNLGGSTAADPAAIVSTE